VGTDQSFEADEIHELLRSIISQAFADVVAKSELALLDLASNYAELSEQVRRTVVERVDDEYGLELPQLVIVNISVPAEVEQALDARSSMGVLGNLGAYQAYQLGASMPAAAENPAGGLAGAGVGVGMGMAMAQRFEANAGGGAGPAAPPPLPTAWHVVENGQARGPLTRDQLAAAIAAGRVGADTLVWSPGMPEWQPARQVPALAALFASAPPPPPR
jgi:hypothetical protein